jgi:hypothetical protein
MGQTREFLTVSRRGNPCRYYGLLPTTFSHRKRCNKNYHPVQSNLDLLCQTAPLRGKSRYKLYIPGLYPLHNPLLVTFSTNT